MCFFRGKRVFVMVLLNAFLWNVYYFVGTDYKNTCEN